MFKKFQLLILAKNDFNPFPFALSNAFRTPLKIDFCKYFKCFSLHQNVLRLKIDFQI